MPLFQKDLTILRGEAESFSFAFNIPSSFTARLQRNAEKWMQASNNDRAIYHRVEGELCGSRQVKDSPHPKSRL